MMRWLWSTILSFKAKNNSCPIVPQPKKTPTISYIEDFEIEIVAGPIDIPVPSIQMDEQYDDDENEGIFEMANTEHNFALSSPVKCKADIVDISVDLNQLAPDPILFLQDELIMEEPIKAKSKIKKWYQMADLPSGTNDNEAFCRIFIPTVYWHIGNQWDIWIYHDDWLASDLKKIFSGVDTSPLEEVAMVIQDDGTDIGLKLFDARAHLIESDSE